MGEQPVSTDTYTHALDRSRLEAGRPSMRMQPVGKQKTHTRDRNRLEAGRPSMGMQPVENTSCASDGPVFAAVWLLS